MKAWDEATAKAALGRAQNPLVERYHASHPPPVPKKLAKAGEQEAMPESDAAIKV